MNIFKIFIPFLLIIQVISFPNNKYCAQNNIFGFNLNLTFFDNDLANISAYIPFKINGNIHCNNEKYTLVGDNLEFPKNNNDCLNVNLKKYNACPCPPDIKFNNDKNIFNVKTPIGIIPLDSC